MEMRIEGRLNGGAAGLGAYVYASGDKKVEIDGDRVAVSWFECPDGSDATEQALKDWFEAEIGAQVIATAVPSSVRWTGRSLFDAGARIGFRVTLGQPFGLIRADPQPLSAYATTADAIRQYPEVAESVRHFRATSRLLDADEDIAPGEAYLSVAVLVVARTGDESQEDWRVFGEALRTAGQPFDGSDLVQLYASCQWQRHHLQRQATKTLEKIQRSRLSLYESWAASLGLRCTARPKGMWCHMNLDEDGPRSRAVVRSVDEMTPGEDFLDRWRGLSDERRRDSAFALVGFIAAVVVVVTIPWVVGVAMIGALQLAAIGLIVYLAVRLALRHR